MAMTSNRIGAMPGKGGGPAFGGGASSGRLYARKSVGGVVSPTKPGRIRPPVTRPPDVVGRPVPDDGMIRLDPREWEGFGPQRGAAPVYGGGAPTGRLYARKPGGGVLRPRKPGGGVVRPMRGGGFQGDRNQMLMRAIAQLALGR